MARFSLEQLIIALRDRHVTPVGDGEDSQVLAQCPLSPTGRHLMARLRTAGTESGYVYWTSEAMLVLRAFVEAKRIVGDGTELDANLLRWLTARRFSWGHLKDALRSSLIGRSRVGDNLR